MIRIKKKNLYTFSDNEEIRKNLRSEALKSGRISIITRTLNTLIQLGGVIVLARLLTPADFGLVMMVTVITNIFVVFQDVGLTDATIQAKSINHDQVSTLFWINLLFSFSFSLVLIALSPAVAWFYKTPELTMIMIVSSISFIFWGLSTQHDALLKRDMQFIKLGMIDIISSFISTVISIIIALLGWRYWAIVFRTIIYSFSKLIMMWGLLKWRPGLPKRYSGVRPFLVFGANSVAFYIVSYFSSNMDKTLIGKKYGAVQLGYYSRAYYLSATPSGQIAGSLFSVAVSTLSKLREEPESYRKFYLKAISTIAFVGMPLSVIMASLSKELIIILLGPQWTQAAAIFSILSLAAGFNVLYSTIGWLHQSLGRSDRWRNWGIIAALIMVSGYFIGAVFGPKGIALSFVIMLGLLTFPGILYAGKPIKLSLRAIFYNVWQYIVAATAAGLVVIWLKSVAFLNASMIMRLIIFSFVYFFLYLLFIIILFRGVQPIRGFLSLLSLSQKKREAHN